MPSVAMPLQQGSLPRMLLINQVASGTNGLDGAVGADQCLVRRLSVPPMADPARMRSLAVKGVVPVPVPGSPGWAARTPQFA